MIGNFWLHPALIYIVGALLFPFIPRALRKPYQVLVPCLAFVTVLSMIGISGHGPHGVFHYLDWTITFGRVDNFSLVFAHIMALMSIIGTVYGLHVERRVEHIAAWLYAAGALGAVFAGDYLTLFLFWEMMAVASAFLVWFRGRKQSLAAGYRYLLVHAAGGLFLLAGIILHYKAALAAGADPSAALAFNHLDVAHPDASTWLILIGFCLNAAVPPLHAWLPDAYSEASVNGAIFMCSLTTKAAVYALVRGFSGMEILIPLGVIMAHYGVVYAVLENDTRKLLAYHIVSQVGYMVAAVGFGTPLAIDGAVAFAFTNILYKGLLFMGCGSVLHMTGKSKFTELGALYNRMPRTFIYTLVGGLSISAFPLTAGFISKTMIIAAATESHHMIAAYLLLMASAGTFLHTGLKVPYYIWFGKNNCTTETCDLAKDPPVNMQWAMAMAAIMCIFVGCYTPYLYGMLPHPEVAAAYHPYTLGRISETLQILLFTALGFFVSLKRLTPENKISLDLDWFYRMGGRAFAWFSRKPMQGADDAVSEAYRTIGLKPLMSTARFWSWFDWNGIDFVVDGIARAVRATGSRVRRLQSGQLQVSILAAMSVVAVILVIYVFA